MTSETAEDPDRTRPLPTEGRSLRLETPPGRRAPPPTRTGAGDESLLALPPGHRLQEFVIESTIGEGGFGVVYLARDTELGRVVAIKEFLPGAFASRSREFAVSIRSEKHRASFEAGRRSFINEARLLAQFDHPALVKVYRYWEENGTAYIAMPYYAGLTMNDWVHEQRDGVSEQQLLRIVDALCDPLEMLHASGVFHRDIAPDNIRILENGKPVLLDLGAARKIMADMTQTLTVILKAGYAPIEQYAEVPTLRQGPWSDVYALAAVLYYCVAGRAPPPAVARMVKDECVPAAVLGAGRYSAGFLGAIDRGLAVRPSQRTRNVSELRSSLGIRRAPTRAIATGAERESGPARPASAPARRSPVPWKRAVLTGFAALVLVLIVVARLHNPSPRGQASTAPAPTPSPVPAAAAPAAAPDPRAQQAIAQAESRISHLKEVLAAQRDASPALFETSDAALDDARVKAAAGQIQAAVEIAQASAEDAARSARGFVLERELAYRQAADQRLKGGDIPGAESALNKAKAMRALGTRL